MQLKPFRYLNQCLFKIKFLIYLKQFYDRNHQIFLPTSVLPVLQGLPSQRVPGSTGGPNLSGGGRLLRTIWIAIFSVTRRSRSDVSD